MNSHSLKKNELALAELAFRIICICIFGAFMFMWSALVLSTLHFGHFSNESLFCTLFAWKCSNYKNVELNSCEHWSLCWHQYIKQLTPSTVINSVLMNFIDFADRRLFLFSTIIWPVKQIVFFETLDQCEWHAHSIMFTVQLWSESSAGINQCLHYCFFCSNVHWIYFRFGRQKKTSIVCIQVALYNQLYCLCCAIVIEILNSCANFVLIDWSRYFFLSSYCTLKSVQATFLLRCDIFFLWMCYFALASQP